MTREAYTRCNHCRKEYIYVLSGHGFGREGGDCEYCFECRDAVRNALCKIPVKFDIKYVPVEETKEYKEIHVGDIERWENNLEERRREGLVAQRIWLGQFDLDNGEHEHIREVVASDGPHKGIGFKVSTYKGITQISVPLEYDIENKKLLGLWRSYE